MKKFFAVSDIHGCFDDMIKALDQAGFCSGHPDHMLIVVGDAFDRGPQNLLLADYFVELDKMGKLIYVLGNHDLFLIDYVKGNVAGAIFNAQNNGMASTVEQISGVKKQESWFKWLEKARGPLSKHPIFKILMSPHLFYETDKFIFVHAGMPNDPRWRDIMTPDDTWFRTDFMFRADYSKVLDGKQVVVGHWHAFRLRAKNNGFLEDPKKMSNHLAYTSDDGQKIGIDGCVNYSHIINVHVHEGEEEK